MDPAEARAVLGLGPQATPTEAREAFRRLVRKFHPDVAPPEVPPAERAATTARITEAYAVLRLAGTDDPARPARPAGPDAAADRPPAAARADRPPDASVASLDARLDADGTLLVHAPAEETFVALFDAAGRIGHVAYFDRQLGLVESIVRFEGGPSCSLVLTMQGRAAGTEVFCTLESIEADPTPPIDPVLEALVEAIVGPG